MSPVRNIGRQLVQRRLWPVAILLIAAMAAVPLALTTEPEPEPAPPAVDVDRDSELAMTPIVAPAEVGDRAKRRKVLGSAKNPFAKPAATPTPAPDEPVDEPKADAPASDDTPGGGGTSPAPISPSAPSFPAPSVPAHEAPKPPVKTYAFQELTIRFGGSDEAGRRSLKRLQALPSKEEPVLIYMGLLKDGKTAQFMLGDGVVPVGDGECHPSPEECETVRLRAGETEFFDVQDEGGNVGAQYQLDLLKIHNPGKASATKAKASVKAAVRIARSGTALRSTVGPSIARLP